MPDKTANAAPTNIPNNASEDSTKAIKRPLCGIVRPIADMADYGAAHWLAVHHILEEAADAVEYDIRLVSESDTAGIILNHIVSNLYMDPMVICDVSGRNPNVMFELGMRIAFEKPVIVIADDTTPFSFDISPLKHFTYPRSLKYADIVKFKSDIGNAILSTLVAFKDPNHRGYLQQFGPIEAIQLSTQQVSVEGMAADIASLRRSIDAIEGAVRQPSLSNASMSPTPSNRPDFYMDVSPNHQALVSRELELSGASISGVKYRDNNKIRMGVLLSLSQSRELLISTLRRFYDSKIVTAIYPLSNRASSLLIEADIPGSALG